MRNFKNLLFLTVLFTYATMVGQTKLIGRVVDDSNEGLPGASVVIQGTGIGVETDFDGNFTIESPASSGIVIISFIGFDTIEVKFSSSKTDLGIIVLKEGGNLLEEVVVVGKGVIDLVQERKTPVAASTIKASEIQNKVGNLEFPEVLNSTPSVYATRQGGGYGDSRINVRGFNQRNTSFIINGQPVNDMENGWVYWSNWQGLSDVAAGIQIQRGLGASKLAVPSVGGTVTIVTKSTEKKEGGRILSMVGNDGYNKNVISYNSGLNENGWAASFLLGRWQGDGYVDGTAGRGTTYFVSLGYKPSEVHAFNFTFTGAGQWHHQRTTRLSIRDFQNFGGTDEINRRFNADWGMLNNEEYSFRRNFYNKPIATLNWDWNINDNLSLSSAFYGSWGRGGGTGLRGRNFEINPFRQDLTNATESTNNGGLDYRRPDGTINFDAVVANNRAGLTYTGGAGSGVYQGSIIGSNTDLFGFDGTNYSRNNADGINSNIAIRRASINSHDWYGAISNLKYETEKFTYSAGIDLRAYRAFHYRVLNDLLGLDGYYSTGNRNLTSPYFERISRDPDVYRPIGGMIQTETYKASPFNNIGQNGDKIDYNNDGIVNWQGFNGMIEYNNDDKLTAVLQAGISNQSYQRLDFFDSSLFVESDVVNMTGGYVKGGANYNFDDSHNLFFNTGFIKRQPLFDGIFPGFSNNVNPNKQNETVQSLELGYGLKGDSFRLNINLYSTLWSDRVETQGFNDFFGPGLDGSAIWENVAQRHRGIELEGFYDITDNLRLTAMASLNDWKYAEDASGIIAEVGNPSNVQQKNLYVGDVKVGDAAQTTANLNLRYSPFKNFNLDANWRYAGDLFADFSVLDTEFDNPENRGSLKLPNYSLTDLGASYRWDFANFTNLNFRVNVNNIFDTVYIAEGSTSIRPGDAGPFTDAVPTSTSTWKGIDTRNNVWFGFGTTWNFTVSYSF